MSASGQSQSARVDDALHFLGDFGRAANDYGATGVRVRTTGGEGQRGGRRDSPVSTARLMHVPALGEGS